MCVVIGLLFFVCLVVGYLAELKVTGVKTHRGTVLPGLHVEGDVSSAEPPLRWAKGSQAETGPHWPPAERSGTSLSCCLCTSARLLSPCSPLLQRGWGSVCSHLQSETSRAAGHWHSSQAFVSDAVAITPLHCGTKPFPFRLQCLQRTFYQQNTKYITNHASNTQGRKYKFGVEFLQYSIL